MKSSSLKKFGKFQSFIPDAVAFPMSTLTKTENSEDERLFDGGDCSPSLVLKSCDFPLAGNVLEKLIDVLLLLWRRPGLMPGDFNVSSGHRRG